MNLILTNNQVVHTRARTIKGVINAITGGKVDTGKGGMAGIKVEENGKIIAILQNSGWLAA